MSSWARVGMKVLCVDGKPRPKSRKTLPKEGVVYTIDWVGHHEWPSGNTGIGVHLIEISRPIGTNGRVNPYGIDRFRPLITPEQDIALFHALCPGLPVVPPAVLKPRVRVEP